MAFNRGKVHSGFQERKCSQLRSIEERFTMALNKNKVHNGGQ